MKVIFMTLAAAGLALTAGCAAAPATEPPHLLVARGVAAHEPPADPRPYGTADTQFGLDLLGAWCAAEPDSNIVFSPESLASGLGMAYLGARGSTAQAMASVLHLPPAGTQLQPGLQARSAALRSLNRSGVSADSSDQLWADPTLSTSGSYLNALATGYDAGVAQVPLLHDPAAAARQIDAAVSAATKGHIPQLVTAGQLQRTGWVLTDALYLDARWAEPFDANDTETGTFTTAAGTKVSARFMSGGPFPVTQAGGWTAVQLPYQGGRLAMVALLPDSRAGGCPALPAATLSAITASLAGSGSSASRAAVMLPKVKLRSSASLKSLLTTLGMGTAFSSDADFTAMSPQAGHLGAVVHAATLDVGEKGTVGSAASAVGVEPGAAAPLPTQVAFDRPYLMLVLDTRTSEPLFLARVATTGG